MDKIVEIYDMLSDGIENSGGVTKIASNREGMKP